MADRVSEDWQVLRGEVIEAFTPGTPINEADLFAGRRAAIRRLQDTVLELGKHAVIYGERGVGKTSIANIFHRPLNTATRKVSAIRINAVQNDTFDSLWRKVFRRIKHGDGTAEWWADDAHPGPLTPDDVQIELSGFPLEQTPIIIIDEFDRVEDESCKVLMTDTIKALSDYTVNCTVVIVGVGESVANLIKGHESISRALSQVPMPRMSEEELRDIVVSRVRRLNIKIDDDALWRITFHSAGLPFYTHSLAKHAALRAVGTRRDRITEVDVSEGFNDCVQDVDYSVLASYLRGTEPIYRKPNIFPQVLAACALAVPDVLGRFGAPEVEGPLSAIMGKPYKTQGFAFHLNKLCSEERGRVLRKTGSLRKFRFYFGDAIMQPFVIMKALQDGILTKDVLDRFAIRRQTQLSI